MKYINEVSEINKVALSMLIFSTCGEDEKTLAETEVKEIGPNIFHITYALDNQFDAMDFQVAIDRVTGTKFKYTIFRSVYGDDGEFEIAIR